MKLYEAMLLTLGNNTLAPDARRSGFVSNVAAGLYDRLSVTKLYATAMRQKSKTKLESSHVSTLED